MRVCILAGSGMWGLLGAQGRSHGGAELQLYLLGRSLAGDVAHDVTFLVYSSEAPPGLSVPWGTVSRFVTPVKRGVPVVSRFVNAARLRRSFEQVCADVFVQSAAHPMTGVAAEQAHRHARAFVFRLASDADLDGSNLPDPRERALYLRGLKGADLIIARSEYQRTELASRYGKDSVIVPNVFAVPPAPPTVEKDSVLWVASSRPLKQPDVFLGLARAFPHERFVMVMPPNDVALFERIREEARAIPNLDFVERVPFTEIQDYFDRAKVFINTSTVEGFPNTFVQAAMGSTPVLSLSVDPDGVLASGGFGRCAGGDVGRLTSDLGEMLADGRLREEMGRAGFSYAKATHDIDTVMPRFKELLSGVVRP